MGWGQETWAQEIENGALREEAGGRDRAHMIWTCEEAILELEGCSENRGKQCDGGKEADEIQSKKRIHENAIGKHITL